ncbi:hypothetical protein JST97_35420 [bacterium]|nr:hypothetical protein [bacterium]
MRHQLSRKPTALSLIETVLAVFLLAAQILLFAGMLARSRQTQRLSQQRHRAVTLAEQKFDEIRAWAALPSNFSSDWSAYQGQISRPEPGFEVRVACNPAGQPVYSPCLGLESQYGSNAKQLRTSLVPVRVQVSWGSASLVLNSLVGEPWHPGPYAIQLQPAPIFTQPVQPDQDFGYTATVTDGQGKPLSDLQMRWFVKPLTGNASIVEGGPRSQQQVKARHLFRRYGVPVHISGTVQLECTAQYHGQPLRQQTESIQLR